jgi:hypothetical protein
MEDPNALQLAISYAELGQSLAFQDFLKMQAEESERLELIALNADATKFEECRTALISWQQHRRIVRAFEMLVLDAARGLKSQELEIENERPDPSRTDRSGW